VRAELALAMHDSSRADRFGSFLPEGALAKNAYRMLDRLEAEPEFLRQEFRLSANPRIVIKNNLAWTAILTGRGPQNEHMSENEAIALAREAVMEDGWRNLNLLHTLAAALYKKAISEPGLNKEALDEGRALMRELISATPPSANDETAAEIRELNACFEKPGRPAVQCRPTVKRPPTTAR